MINIMKVAILTSGGLAPCLSAAVGGLIKRYTELDPSIEILTYLNGYQGLLLGQSRVVSPQARIEADLLFGFGGSPIGNSRVKLSNAADCEKKELITAGENPFEVAAQQLIKDKVDVLHTIGGDDTSTTAAELFHFLEKHNYPLRIVGLPKTVDNDIVPIKQSLGAQTAAEQGAIFFENVVHEHSANPGMLVVHEVMGRHCGWLTYATARIYMERLAKKSFPESLGFLRDKFAIHACYVPERDFNLQHEIQHLRPIFERLGSLNIFVSEGACVPAIVQEMESRGENLPRDAFGHVKLDHVNAGKWVGEQIMKALNAQKMLVQKSGYFARSSAANAFDLRLIQSCVDFAVECALSGKSGLVGHDTSNGNKLSCIDFTKVTGARPLDVNDPAVIDFFKSLQ